jgi:hypothetical protein
MKLLRYRTVDAVELGVLKSGHEHRIIPLAAISADYPTMRSIIEGGDAALSRVKQVAEAGEGAFNLADVRLLAPRKRSGWGSLHQLSNSGSTSKQAACRAPSTRSSGALPSNSITKSNSGL